MRIIVLASAARQGGALSIYRQFLKHLPEFIGNNIFYVFVDDMAERPPIDGVEYIVERDRSWRHRIWFDWIGLKRWTNARGIVPDVLVSFQNTGAAIDCRQVVYYHQPLPFFPRKWSVFKSDERLMFLYKNIYPLFVSASLKKNTDVVVQIPFIKKGFVKMYRFPEKRVHILFPDFEEIDVEGMKPTVFRDGWFHFVYPATGTIYKEHLTLVRALVSLRMRNPSLVKDIRIHLTIWEKDNVQLYEEIVADRLEGCFVFDGMMPHERLLSMYKASDGLLFPSTIETLGLPLLEGATFGIPVVVSDLDYSREVIGKYNGAAFVDAYDFDKWGEMIEKICEKKLRFTPMKVDGDSSWKEFFGLIEYAGF